VFSVVIFFPFHLIVALAEASVDLVLNGLDTLLLDPLRFGYEVAEQFFQNISHEYLYIPSEEYEGVKNINYIATNNLNNDRFQNQVTQSQRYTLSLFFTDKGKEQYLEEFKFYKRMKEMDCFETKTLRLFCEWKKFRQLKILAPDISMPDDVLKTITDKLIDLSDSDQSVKSTTTFSNGS
jgi:hypothetical protein